MAATEFQRMSVVLKITVGDSGYVSIDNLSGSHLQNQSNIIFVSSVFLSLVIDLKLVI